MLCEQCKKNEASVHVSHTVNGMGATKHLCQICAGDAKIETISFQDFVNSFFGTKGAASGFAKETADETGLVCKKCGRSFPDFKKAALLSCDECYDTFKEGLLPFVKQLNGTTKHAGKYPQKLDVTIKIEREREQLQKQLQEAIQNEDFEQACLYRDRLKTLGKETKAGEL